MLLLAACATPRAQRTPPAPVSTGAVKIGNPYVVFGKSYVPADDREYDARGIASWYGPGFHALATANGERYDQDDVTAAHKTLPMPSWVEVENLDNGRKLVVRINDRGPFVDGRIIDLSRRSAQLLGVDRAGLAKVRVRRVYPEAASMIAAAPGPAASFSISSVPAAVVPANDVAKVEPQVRSVMLPPAALDVPTIIGSHFVQVAALADPGRIAWLKGFLASFGPVLTQSAPSGLTRVRIGPFNDANDANAALAKLRSAGYADARLINP